MKKKRLQKLLLAQSQDLEALLEIVEKQEREMAALKRSVFTLEARVAMLKPYESPPFILPTERPYRPIDVWYCSHGGIPS